jgi:hypothetical protein
MDFLSLYLSLVLRIWLNGSFQKDIRRKKLIAAANTFIVAIGNRRLMMLESAMDIHIDSLYAVIEELRLKIQQLEKQNELQRKDIIKLESDIRFLLSKNK